MYKVIWGAEGGSCFYLHKKKGIQVWPVVTRPVFPIEGELYRPQLYMLYFLHFHMLKNTR